MYDAINAISPGNPYNHHSQDTEGVMILPFVRILVCVLTHVPTPHDSMDCSPPGSSVHGIFQATKPQQNQILNIKK